ncbi:hypothetical protein Hanom_Chr06g00557751 [Helianthus anomalus]
MVELGFGSEFSSGFAATRSGSTRSYLVNSVKPESTWSTESKAVNMRTQVSFRCGSVNTVND